MLHSSRDTASGHAQLSSQYHVSRSSKHNRSHRQPQKADPAVAASDDDVITPKVATPTVKRLSSDQKDPRKVTSNKTERDLPGDTKRKRGKSGGGGGFKSFFTLKEPSHAAFEQYAEQQRKQAAERGVPLQSSGIPGVSVAKLPSTVPKVNSRWNGLPEASKQKAEGSANRGSFTALPKQTRRDSASTSTGSSIASYPASPSLINGNVPTSPIAPWADPIAPWAEPTDRAGLPATPSSGSQWQPLNSTAFASLPRAALGSLSEVMPETPSDIEEIPGLAYFSSADEKIHHNTLHNTTYITTIAETTPTGPIQYHDADHPQSTPTSQSRTKPARKPSTRSPSSGGASKSSLFTFIKKPSSTDRTTSRSASRSAQRPSHKASLSAQHHRAAPTTQQPHHTRRATDVAIYPPSSASPTLLASREGFIAGEARSVHLAHPSLSSRSTSSDSDSSSSSSDDDDDDDDDDNDENDTTITTVTSGPKSPTSTSTSSTSSSAKARSSTISDLDRTLKHLSVTSAMTSMSMDSRYAPSLVPAPLRVAAAAAAAPSLHHDKQMMITEAAAAAAAAAAPRRQVPATAAAILYTPNSAYQAPAMRTAAATGMTDGNGGGGGVPGLLVAPRLQPPVLSPWEAMEVPLFLGSSGEGGDAAVGEEKERERERRHAYAAADDGLGKKKKKKIAAWPRFVAGK